MPAEHENSHSRILNWRPALITLARELNGQAYVWGSTDCASVALRAYASMYHQSPFNGIGKMSTKRTIMRKLSQVGNIIDWLETRGFYRVDKMFAQCGDLAIECEEGRDIPSISIILGSNALVIDEEDGVSIVSRWDLDDDYVYMRHQIG